MSSGDPSNVLVIHFGQLGDVVLGLPALAAIRERFSGARLTVLTGTPADQIVRLAGIADSVEGVDRRALKYGSKARAVANIVRLAFRIRRERYDAVVDLHAFYETGLLARFSGAPFRAGPHRRNRSLPFLYTNVAPLEDLSSHIGDRYMAVAEAAGARPVAFVPRIVPDAADDASAARRLATVATQGGRLVGLNPGAGWEIRKWPRDRFVELGRRLARDGARIVVFAGPEEPGLGAEIASETGPAAAPMEGLSLGELAAVMSRCDLVVSNDTGPSHISAATGTPTLVLMPGNAGPSPCEIRGDQHRLIYGETILAITVDEVVGIASEMLARPRAVGQ